MRPDPKRPRNLLADTIKQTLNRPLFTTHASQQALQCAQRAQRLKEQMEWLSEQSPVQ